jgi:predicted O-methyltransferase YrrM
MVFVSPLRGPDVIPQEKINGAKLYSTRYEFLKTLEKNIKYLEVGVLAGDFSMSVIEEVSPSTAALVDTFQTIDYNATEYEGARWDLVGDHFNFVRSRFKDIPSVRLYRQYFEQFVMVNQQKFNFIYLDACNDYLSVRRYLERSAEIIEDGGIIGINDYSIYENNTEATTHERTGVVKAVNEFIRNTDWHVHAFALNDSLTSDIYIKKNKLN